MLNVGKLNQAVVALGRTMKRLVIRGIQTSKPIDLFVTKYHNTKKVGGFEFSHTVLVCFILSTRCRVPFS